MQQNLNSDLTDQMSAGVPDLAGAWPLIKQSWAFYKKHWPQFVKLILFPLIPVIGLLIVLGLYAVAQAAGFMSSWVNIILSSLGIVSILAIIVVSLFVYPAMYLVVKSGQEGLPAMPARQAGDPSARLGGKKNRKIFGRSQVVYLEFFMGQLFERDFNFRGFNFFDNPRHSGGRLVQPVRGDYIF